jgi:hypothetical protein
MNDRSTNTLPTMYTTPNFVHGIFVGEESDGDEEIDKHEESVVVVECQEGHCHQSGN